MAAAAAARLIAYDLTQATKVSSNTYDIETQDANSFQNRKNRQTCFVICNSCYWSASYLVFDKLAYSSESSLPNLNCRLCNSCKIKQIPISTDESFRIEYNPIRGMEIEFYRSNNIVAANDQSVDD